MIFERAVEILLSLEGGHVNNPNDPGGETNFGISKKAYPHLDIARLTRQDAISIYRTDYWDMVRADLLPPRIRYMVFDSAVNHGIGFTVGTLQAAVGAPVTGKMDGLTLTKTASARDVDVLKRIVARRFGLYRAHPKFSVFGKGWISRLLESTIETLT